MKTCNSIRGSPIFERSQSPYNLSGSKAHLPQTWPSNSRPHETRVTRIRAGGKSEHHLPTLVPVLANRHCRDSAPPREVLCWTFYQHLMDITDWGHLVKSKWSEPKFPPGTVFLKNQWKNMIYFPYKLTWNTLVIKWGLTNFICNVSSWWDTKQGHRLKKWGCLGQEAKTSRTGPPRGRDPRHTPSKRQTQR